jgi:hypothetical protein
MGLREALIPETPGTLHCFPPVLGGWAVWGAEKQWPEPRSLPVQDIRASQTTML